jgi:hypothetical protein
LIALCFVLFVCVPNANAPPNDADQIGKDEKKATQLVKLMDKEKALENTLFENRTFVEAEAKQKLDVLISYLRAVHFYCYYTAVEATLAHNAGATDWIG